MIALKIVAIISAALAAGFWLWSAFIEISDNIDTIVAGLQRASRLSGYGAIAASVAATCEAMIWILGR